MQKASLRVIAFMMIVLSLNAYATVKRVLKGNMTLVYKVVPPRVDNFLDMFSDGMFYGRFRTNSFINKAQVESANRRSTWSTGIGGSIIYKTAYFKGFGATAGLYTSQNPWHENQSEIPYFKGDRQTFSRYNAIRTGNFNMTVLAQAYLEYKNYKSDIKVGRQIFESRLTASNDTFMIPNTFNGISYVGKHFSKTTIKLAYFTQEKLRAHTNFSSVFSYDTSDKAAYSQWTQNDDAGMPHGITTAKLAARNITPRLVIAQINNRSIKNLKLMLNYTSVPKLVSSITLDSFYKIDLPDSFSIIPGIRYMQQFDEGAGVIGGPNLDDNATGYTNKTSVNGKLYGARLDVRRGRFLGRLGYTYIANEADMIAPWRGYPTGGFTRVMGQYNWYANTASYMLRLGYNFKNIGINTFARYAVQDFDKNKPGEPFDHNAIEWDATKTFASIPNLYLKLRLEYVSYPNDTRDIAGTITHAPTSFGDYRFGINYLF